MKDDDKVMYLAARMFGHSDIAPGVLRMCGNNYVVHGKKYFCEKWQHVGPCKFTITIYEPQT